GDIETPTESKALVAGIGGNGGSASNGGTVTISNFETGALSVSGEGSVGIFAQSLGGGGGSGGVGVGGSISAAEDSEAVTQLEFGLGGAAGGGGSGGQVSILNQASISSVADPSGGAAQMHGIHAQSIGGGGGEGSLGIEGDVTGSENSQALSLAIGGSGGNGGRGAAGRLN
ncbi:MAG: hypothetical protein AAFY02_22515, partial [Pseudomonadota bacterium]